MKLRELRNTRNFTQAQVAKIIGVTQSTYNYYEKEKTQPDFDILIKIADLYNVSIDYLLGREFGSDLELGYLSTEKKEAVKLLLKLNDLNFIKAVSYMAGLYTAQG